ncbi:MAG: ShlB/FhaC/HecB family hemolysin secretion/activation protein [Cyanophyceae cyanobacterium]
MPTRGVAQSPPPETDLPPTVPEILEQILPESSDSPVPEQEPLPTPNEPQLQFPAPQPTPEIAPPRATLPVETVEIWGSTVLREQIVETINSGQYQNLEQAELICQPTVADRSVAESQPPQTCIIRAKVNDEGITFEELLTLRSAVTQLYIENDYITSGAFLPVNQVLEDVVRLQVVEGKLEQVEISGLNRLREGYVRSRLGVTRDTPLNQERLLDALRLLQLDPLIEQINAELTAGTTTGRSVLLLSLAEAPAFHSGVFVGNNRPPSIGSTQGGVFIAHDNLLGLGDRFRAEYGTSEGLDLYDISYAIPINASNGTVSFRYSNSDSDIIADDFRDLEINSEADTFSVGFRQPIVRLPETEVALGLSLDLRRSQSFLGDRPFSFFLGSDNGESNVTVLRFSQEWVERRAERILSVRSELSFGLDAFEATINDTGTDGQFFAWRKQFQYAQQLPANLLLLTGVSAQLTPDSLLLLERIAIGGISTVKGYQENQLVADNGVIGSVEVRIPLVDSVRNQLQLAPFFELGSVWNNDAPDPEPSTIVSLGTGLLWQLGSSLDLRLYYGIPLVSVDRDSDSLQANGLHFLVRYQLF